MSLSRRIAFAVFSNWLNRILTIGLGLVFTRALFSHLIKEEQGLWLLLGNSTALLALLDLGLTPTLTRRIALAYGKNGDNYRQCLNDESKRELTALFYSGVRIYRLLSVIAFLSSWVIGIIFLRQLHFEHVSPVRAQMAWTILSFAYAVGVWGQIWQCLLNGLGLVGWNTIAGSFVAVLALAAQLVVVLNGGGLMALAITNAIGGLAGRQIGIIMARRMCSEILTHHEKWEPQLVRSMVSPALRSWATGIGGFLILQTDQYFISYFKGTSQLPEYQAAYQIPLNLFVFAVTFAVSSSVYISHLWQAGEIKRVHAIVQRSARLGMSLMVCGIACLIVAGEPLINLWLGPGHFVGYTILITFCAMITLEAHHVIIASCSRATEDEAFVIPAISAGILNILFTAFLIGPLGLWGVALGTLMAQLLTNNWYAVYRGLRRLKMSIREHLRQVIYPVIITFLIALAVGWFASYAVTSFHNDVINFAAAAASTGFVLLMAIWFQVMTPSDRLRIRYALIHPTALIKSQEQT